MAASHQQRAVFFRKQSRKIEFERELVLLKTINREKYQGVTELSDWDDLDTTQLADKIEECAK